ncbi:MAG: MOP flippase family protein [Prolixibacteraceae bacterium]
MSLKQKTVSGIFWSFIDTFAGQGIQFLTGIVLARILSPREFGLIGMIAVFIAVSESFINSGFGSALIRKKDCTQNDFSTVFYFNMTAGLVVFLLLYFLAPVISNFFDEPALKPIVQVFGLVLLIDSLSLIQKTLLIKRIDFKLQARISIIASVGSGIIAIGMAWSGFGVWSLVVQRLSRQTLISVFMWLWNTWRPIAVFSKKSFRELFGFGSKLMISGLIDTLYQNIYYLVIGKFFSAQELGYYTRADQFKTLPSQNLTAIISRVSYPVLSGIQDDKARLKTNYQKLIRGIMLITFVLMMGMAAVAEPMIITLIGEKWRPAVVYLQMLSFVGMFYPLNALNLNMLQVMGRSDLFLKLEIIKKTLALPIILVGIFLGIKLMIAGMILNSMIAWYINSYWSGHLIGYSFRQQVKDILPAFALGLSMALIVYLIGRILILTPAWTLVIQVTAGAIYVFLMSELVKFPDYIFIKDIILERRKAL